MTSETSKFLRAASYRSSLFCLQIHPPS